MAFHQNTNNAVRQPTPSAAIGHIISPLVTAHVAHTHTHSVLTAIFPGEPGLAGCPLNSPSPFIPGLRILLGQV